MDERGYPFRAQLALERNKNSRCETLPIIGGEEILSSGHEATKTLALLREISASGDLRVIEMSARIRVYFMVGIARSSAHGVPGNDLTETSSN